MEKNIVIRFIFYILFIKAKLDNYISLQFHMIDDCIREIDVSGTTIYAFTPEELSKCDFAYQSNYPEFFTKNLKYEYGSLITFIFQDSCHYDGFMNITVYFNEYIITIHDQRFWECIDCDSYNKNYVYENGRLNFYSGRGNGDKFEKNYTFIFQINNIQELYNGGEKGHFKVNNEYYAFNDKKTFYLQIHYLDNELELINFNTPDNFHIKDNSTFPVEFSDYIFNVKYINNDFSGTLSALSLSNDKIDLNNDYNFKISNEMGIKYKLTNEEKNNRAVNVSLKITAYNENNEQVAKETEFYFIITVYGEPDESEPSDTSKINTDISGETSKENSQIDIMTETSGDKIKDNTKDNSKETIKDNSNCLDKYISHDTNKDIYSYICPNYTTNEIEENLSEIVNKIDIDKNYKIQASDYITLITSIDYSDPPSKINTEIFFPSSYVNFSECEEILRNENGILSPRKITFIQIEINNTIDDVLVNQIEYKAYDDNKGMLNLSSCNNKRIDIHYSLKDNATDKINLINSFKEKGINILDINDDFFNDVCIPYSESGDDLTLNDRIQEIYKNYTFCEKNCEIKEIDYDDMMITCNCTVKNNLNVKDINFDIPERNNETKNMNYKIIKCLNSFSSIKDNLYNLGFWIFLFLMILNIILLIIFCCYGIRPLETYIKKIMVKYGYIGQSDEGHAFCHNYVKKLDKLIERLKKMKSDFLKNKASPPKRKIHMITDRSEGKKKFIKKSSSINKNNKNFESEIEDLKKRMEKTKKLKFQNNNKIKVFTKNNDNLIVDSSKKKLNKKEKKADDKNKEEEDIFKINLININVDDLNKKDYIPKESEHVLNIYEFNEAIKYDKRGLFLIYYIFLLSKQVILHAFLYNSPLEPLPLRLSILKFILGCDLALNAFFYTDDKISQKHNSNKNIIVFAFTNNFIVILLAILIGYVLLIFISNLNNCTSEIRKIFRDEENKIKNDKKYYVSLQRKKEIIIEVKKIIKKFKIKVVIFYIIEFLLMILFWYYVTIFCYIYNKTQISWLFDTLITIILRIIFDLLLNFLLALLYKSSINFKSNCLYRVIIFFYCFA